MARSLGGCAGWGVAGVLLVVMIGQCVGDAPADPDTTPGIATPGRDWRFIRPERANCRASSAVDAPVLERLNRNAMVGVLDTADGWSRLDRVGRPCWVRSDLLALTEVAEPTPPPAPVRRFAALDEGSDTAPAQRRRASRGSGSTYYANCSAARAAGAAPVLRGEPGYARRLDRDGDGVGCE